MANDEEGYEDHRFEKVVDRNFYCPICLNVLKDPVQCRNQHLFCSPCIKRHLEQRSQTCPTCREELTAETLVQPRIVINLLSALKIGCDFAARGCRQLVELEFLKRHVAHCGYSPTKCENDGCSMIINKIDKEHHENNDCGFRKVKCEECGEEVLYKKFKTHGCTLKNEIDEVKTSLNEMKTEVKDQLGMMRGQMQRNQEEMIQEVRRMTAEMKRMVNKQANEAKEELKYVKTIIEGPSLANTRGNIVVAGGHDGNYPLNSVERFSWIKRTWEPLQSMKQRRDAASSFVYQQQMFVAGGYSGGLERLDSLESLNIDEKPGQWLDFDAKLPVKLYAHTNVVYQNRLIVTGGCTVRNEASDGIYEILLTPPYSSKLLCKMPQPSVFHCSQLFEDNIFTFGGKKTVNNKESTDNVLLYNITTKKCEQKAPLPFAVNGMASVSCNDDVILMGGVDKNGNVLDTVVKYDVKTGKSELLPPMKYKRQGCAAVVTGNVVVVMGGYNEKQVQLNSVEYFNFDCYAWKELPPMIGKEVVPNCCSN